MVEGVVLVACLLVGIVLLFIPQSIVQWMVDVFGFSKKGIRYIRRRRDNVDSLGNFFLFLGFLFSVVYVFIPFYMYVYMGMVSFFFLCTLAQGLRVTKKAKKGYRFLVCYGVYVLFVFGILMNVYAGFGHEIFLFKEAFLQGLVFDVFYLLTNPCVMVYVLQAILFMIPVYALIAQFKYMRLENTFKAVHLATYLFKILFVCFILYVLSSEGLAFLNQVYQVQEQKA